MNRPGSPSGNWTWRFLWRQLTPGIRNRLREMATLYGRASAPPVLENR